MKCPVPAEVYRMVGAPPHDQEETKSQWRGGIFRFYNMPYDDLELAARLMGEPLLARKACGYPTVRELLIKSEPHRPVTSFSGYIVSPAREDERLSIAGITTASTPDTRDWLSNSYYFRDRGGRIWAGWKG